MPRGAGLRPCAAPRVTGAGVCSYRRTSDRRSGLEGPGLAPCTRLSMEWAAGRGCSRGFPELGSPPGRGLPGKLVVEEVPLWEVGHPGPSGCSACAVTASVRAQLPGGWGGQYRGAQRTRPLQAEDAGPSRCGETLALPISRARWAAP